MERLEKVNKIGGHMNAAVGLDAGMSLNVMVLVEEIGELPMMTSFRRLKNL
jgi:hypothetical protein